VLALTALGIAGVWYYRQNPDAFAFGRGARETAPSPTFPSAGPLMPEISPPPTTLAAVASPVTTSTPPPPIPTTLAVAPTPISVPTPIATAPAVTRPSTTPPPTAAPAGNILEQARTALRSGQHDEAARAFAAHIRRAPRGTATIQLLVACSTDTVQKAMTEVGSNELFILPVSYQGRSCYRMCWGLYADGTRGASALRSLPDYFRRGGASPRVVTAADVLR
jgi:septal ring-binding cell division protein DamX